MNTIKESKEKITNALETINRRHEKMENFMNEFIDNMFNEEEKKDLEKTIDYILN